MSHLSNARIHFNDQGMPVASDFDDIYFSDAGGLAETDYVFLAQNGLPQRWQQHTAASFHIIETGFGTGANFLLTWLRFKQFRQQFPDARCQRLYFSSAEKYPLTLTDLQRALLLHTELQPLCQQLLTQYPLTVPGCHRLVFEQGHVTLDLWFGDVADVLPDMSKTDAIYLDGFAPSKNPQMWQPSLFAQLAAQSRLGTTVSTFTAAGIVKRGLKEAGFDIKKVKGFGPKRDMLTASMQQPPANEISKQSPDIHQVTIVGGGIASLCTALALSQRNIAVQLICADNTVAMQASQNRQGAVYPNLHAELTDASLLHVQAFLFARQFYQRWQQQGLDFAMDWCGMLHLATTDTLQQRQQKLMGKHLWPEQLVQAVDANAATELAGIELQQQGIYFPLAGWLSPQQFCSAALAHLKQQPGFQMVANCTVQQVSEHANGWALNTSSGDIFAHTVVLAAGSQLAELAPTISIPLNKVRGQVSHIAQPKMAALKTLLCHKGYIAPQWQGLHSVGATFDRHADTAFISEDDDALNLQLVDEQLQTPEWFSDSVVVSAAAAFRATLPDRLPAAGQIAPGLYACGGMAARGILLSPLMGELIACQILTEPLPLSASLQQKVSPRRF